MPSVDQLIVWIVVGLLGGGLAGALTTWERGGFGLFRNLALGLAGASSAGCCSAYSGFGRAWTRSPSRFVTSLPPSWARFFCSRRSGFGANSARRKRASDLDIRLRSSGVVRSTSQLRRRSVRHRHPRDLAGPNNCRRLRGS